MAILSPPPKLQFFDANGNPLVGGKLYSYAAGTTTPLATYTDSTQVSANPNPIILDSRGEAGVWLGSSLYKLALYSATDVLIWSVDNVNSATQTLGTGVATWLATPSSANLRAAVTDETGSGALVFSTSPTLTSPTLTSPTLTNPTLTNPTLGDATLSSINGGQIAGFRNRIINGGMQILQRSLPVITGALQFGADRWQGLVSGGTGISGSFTQSTSTSYTSGYYFGFGSASWTNGTAQFHQRIEANNVQDLSGKTITVSAKIFQDTGGSRNFAIQLYKPNAKDNWAGQTFIQSIGTGSVASGAVTSISATFTLGGTDAVNGLGVFIVDTVNNTVVSKNYFIGDVQLEIGSVVTPFEQRSYNTELALCQRYYQSGSDRWDGYATNTVLFSTPVGFTMAMRATPTIVQTNTANTSFTVTTGISSPTYLGFYSSRTANATGNGAWTENWTASAEL